MNTNLIISRYYIWKVHLLCHSYKKPQGNRGTRCKTAPRLLWRQPTSLPRFYLDASEMKAHLFGWNGNLHCMCLTWGGINSNLLAAAALQSYSPRIWEMMRPDASGETTEQESVGVHGCRVWRSPFWTTGKHCAKCTWFLAHVDFILGWFFYCFCQDGQVLPQTNHRDWQTGFNLLITVSAHEMETEKKDRVTAERLHLLQIAIWAVVLVLEISLRVFP